MRVAVTGATGFLGRYLVKQLTDSGHTCRCWFRSTSRLDGIDVDSAHLDWITGELGDREAAAALVEKCDAVVHAALWRPGGHWNASGSDLIPFVYKNLIGTLDLILAAREANVGRFVFVSTCAVHDEILPDRALDEAHPLWPKSHYGAHKAAIEKFVHSFGLGDGFPICALRPTGIYGIAHPLQASKWFELVRAVVAGESVQVGGGGKEVHAADVARAIEILLNADGIAGQCYNCYERYISQYDVAMTAKNLSGSSAEIVGDPKQPLNQIETEKIRALGMTFGGWPQFEATIGQMVDACTPA